MNVFHDKFLLWYFAIRRPQFYFIKGGIFYIFSLSLKLPETPRLTRVFLYTKNGCPWWASADCNYYSVNSTAFANRIHALLQIFLNVTLSKVQDMPAHIGQFIIDFLVPLNIPLQLLLPLFLVGINLFSRVFLVPFGMPKITINKNSNAVPCNRNLRRTVKPLIVFLVTQSTLSAQLVKNDSRLNILTMNIDIILERFL